MAIKDSQVQKGVVFDKDQLSDLEYIAKHNGMNFSKLLYYICEDFLERYGKDIEFEVSFKIKREPVQYSISPQGDLIDNSTGRIIEDKQKTINNINKKIEEAVVKGEDEETSLPLRIKRRKIKILHNLQDENNNSNKTPA